MMTSSTMHMQVCTLDRCCEPQRTHLLQARYRMLRLESSKRNYYIISFTSKNKSSLHSCICDRYRDIHIYMCICIYICVYVCVHVYAYVYVYVSMYVCVYVYVYIGIYMYVYACKHVYVYMYICIIHTYTRCVCIYTSPYAFL